MRRSILILLFLPVALGCSQMNVDVGSDRRAPHEKIFPEDMKGRSADFERPKVIEIAPVKYPAETADLDVSGIVMIKLLIGMDGNILEAKIQQGVHPLVDQTALKAAREGRYAPANEFGAATDGWLTVPFRFPPPQETQ